MMTSGDKDASQKGALAGSGQLPQGRRLYRKVTVERVEDQYCICLDGRALRTPLKTHLSVPAMALAEAIAAEWSGQGSEIAPAQLVFTRLATTAIDQIAGAERDEIIENIVGYAGFDLVCFRAARPQGLVDRQAAAWDPVIFWAEQHLAVPFQVSIGTLEQTQDEQAIAAVRAQVLKMTDPFVLAGFQDIVRLTGSVLISLGLLEGAFTSDAAWLAAYVDEIWQIEHWGEDSEAAERQRVRRVEFDAAVLFLPQSV